MMDLYIDFKSAAAYLSMNPTLALVERLGVEICWHPFRTTERDLPKLAGTETVGESHRRVRAESQRAIAMKYAQHQAIDLRFPAQVGETR